MKGKDLLQKRSKDEESLLLAIMGEQRELKRLKDSLAGFQAAIKEHEKRLKELEDMDIKEWRKKNENQS